MTYTCYTLSQKGLIFLGPSGRSNKGSNILYFISSIESFSKVMTMDSMFLNAHQSCGSGVRTLSASGCHFKLWMLIVVSFSSSVWVSLVFVFGMLLGLQRFYLTIIQPFSNHWDSMVTLSLFISPAASLRCVCWIMVCPLAASSLLVSESPLSLLTVSSQPFLLTLPTPLVESVSTFFIGCAVVYGQRHCTFGGVSWICRCVHCPAQLFYGWQCVGLCWPRSYFFPCC